MTALASQRQAHILDELERLGAVRVSRLVESLGVSDMTVRRDLDALAQRGLLTKVHGGAMAIGERSNHEPGFEAKQVRAQVEKDAIAHVAAELISPGSAVGISAGTTTWTLAHLVRDIPGLTVVTNSMRIADVVLSSGRSDQTVVLTGGIRTPSDALVGPVAVAALRSLHLDLVFLGVHGMDERSGFTTPNLMESETDRALVEAGRRLVVVADHTKWGTVGLSTIVPLDVADILITDDEMPPEALAVLRERVPEVVVARRGLPVEQLHEGAR
ncbi:MAG: DeoR family transcriptional regulator [Frankiales bacterium]|nr:DeoR family transcriptional regulator [Frankiales bacterium]